MIQNVEQKKNCQFSGDLNPQTNPMDTDRRTLIVLYIWKNVENIVFFFFFFLVRFGIIFFIFVLLSVVHLMTRFSLSLLPFFVISFHLTAQKGA